MNQYSPRLISSGHTDESAWARRVRVFFRRGWMGILVFAGLGALAGWLVGMQNSQSHTATAVVYVGVEQTTDEADLYQGGAFVQNQMPSFAELARTQLVLQPVVNELDSTSSVEELRGRLSVLNPPGTSMLNISIEDASREDAIRQANSVAASLESAIVQASNTGPGAGTRLSVQTVEEASASTGRGEGYIEQQIIVFAIGGAALATLVLMLMAVLDRRVRGSMDVTPYINAPVVETKDLSDIPSDAEASAYLQSLVRGFDVPRADSTVWAVLSVDAASEGQPVATYVARCLSEQGHNVIVVDGSKPLKFSASASSNQTPSPEELIQLVRKAEVPIGNVPASGWGEPSRNADMLEPLTVRLADLRELGWDLRRNDHIEQLLHVLASRAEDVVVSLAPPGIVPWSAAMAVCADAIIMVAQRDKTRLVDLRRTDNILRENTGRTLATVLSR